MGSKAKVMESLGKHILLDLKGCSFVDSSIEVLHGMFSEALRSGCFTIMSQHYHQFEPHGVSGVYILAESHLSFHIWVELNFVSLDVYWCGKKCDEQILINQITKFFQPQQVYFKFLDRGII